LAKYDSDRLNTDHDQAELRVSHFAKQYFYNHGIWERLGEYVRKGEMPLEEFFVHAYMAGATECYKKPEVHDAVSEAENGTENETTAPSGD